jgi:hypothetical protein
LYRCRDHLSSISAYIEYHQKTKSLTYWRFYKAIIYFSNTFFFSWFRRRQNGPLIRKLATSTTVPSLARIFLYTIFDLQSSRVKSSFSSSTVIKLLFLSIVIATLQSQKSSETNDHNSKDSSISGKKPITLI